MAEPQSESENLEQTRALLNRARFGRGITAFAVWCVLVNIFVLLVRPQNDIPILALIQFPLFLSIFSFGAWLPKSTRGWSKQMRYMLAIVLMGGLWVPFALNNRWAFEGFRVLAQLFLMIIFPLGILCQGSKWLEKLFNLLCFVGFYLAVYTATHSGQGPGDYMGDENDVCMVLVMLLALVLGLLGVPRTTGRKVVILIICGALLGGIVITSSRGGFLGLVAAAGFHVLHARRRVGFFILAMILAGLTFVLAPQQYWDRISTISDTNTGSAKERRESWNFAWDLFTRNDVIVLGVGMKNTPMHLGDYKTSTSRNLWGRQVHSLYFELLPDLGIVGACLALGVLLPSFFGNRRLIKASTKTLSQLRRSGEDSPERRTALKELAYLRAISISTNGAWIGVLVCGGFISIFYYPPLWLLAGISTAIQGYGAAVQAAADTLIPKTEERRALPRSSPSQELLY